MRAAWTLYDSGEPRFRRTRWAVTLDLRAWYIGAEVDPSRWREDPLGQSRTIRASLGPLHLIVTWWRR